MGQSIFSNLLSESKDFCDAPLLIMTGENTMENFNFQFTEEQLEDYLYENIEKHYDMKVIKRQFKIPKGRIDILAKSNKDKNLYYVIEVKTGNIDANSVCQVFRYSNYLNSELSKNGKRVFVPLLIGRNLSSENNHIIYLLNHFDGALSSSFVEQNKIYYSIYNIDFSGIRLDYFYKKNEEYMSGAFQECYSRIEYFDVRNYQLSLHNKKLEQKITALKKKVKDAK